MWKRQVQGEADQDLHGEGKPRKLLRNQVFQKRGWHFSVGAHTALLTAHGSNLSHPTYTLVVEEELLIPSRSLPGHLRSKSRAEQARGRSRCRGRAAAPRPAAPIAAHAAGPALRGERASAQLSAPLLSRSRLPSSSLPSPFLSSASDWSLCSTLLPAGQQPST